MSKIMKELIEGGGMVTANVEVTVKRFQNVHLQYDIDENEVVITATELIDLVKEHMPEKFL